jgi:hypothetical protein
MADGGLNVERLRMAWRRPGFILLVGLVLREAFSFWTGHPYDMEVWLRNAYFVGLGQNPYDHFLPPVPGLSFAYLQDSIPSVGYLPAWSLVLAGLYRGFVVLPGANRFVFYFLLKQPAVLGDVALGFAIFRTVNRWGGSADTARRALKTWMIFPYPIVIGAVWGQFDATVVDLILLSMLSSNWLRQYGSLGIGIFLKWFPLVLLPFLAMRERWLRKPGVLLAVAIPGVLSIAVFSIMNWDYVGVTGMAEYTSHGNIGGITYMSLLGSPLAAGVLSRIPDFYAALGYLWVPGILIGGVWGWRRFRGEKPDAMVQGFLLSTMVFFLTRQGVNEQYLMYLLPLLLIDVLLWHPERSGLFRLTWILCFAFLLVNNDLLVRFLGPVSDSFVNIAYAADASTVLGGVRTYAGYVLDVLITITFAQLIRTIANPKRSARPWPSLLAVFFRTRLLGRSTSPEANP